MAAYERLTPQDASFLYAESSVAHMHVGAMCVFEDAGVSLDDIYAHIEARLDLVPRFRRKLMWVPYHQGRPVWVDDEHFDVRFHVRHTGLPRPGGERELLNLMGRVQSQPLDRQRPLWEIWIVDLHDDRRALIQKTHHALIDGISGVDLATVLLDLTPDSPRIPAPPWAPDTPPTKGRLLRDSLVERSTQPAEIVRSIRASFRAPRLALERYAEMGKGVLSFGRAVQNVAPRTTLTQQIGPHRRFEIVRTRLEDVKAVKARFGCTVNDVVLSLVAGGLRELLLSRGERLEDLQMRAAVPVSVRDDSERMTYGNKVAAMFAELPVGEPDAVERLRRVQEQMAVVKESKEAVGAEVLMQLADFAPPTILALAGRALASQWTINLTVTNVPGPQFPLYFRGGRLLEAFPYVPLVGTTTVGVAVLSYDGQLNFGLVGDWDAVSDLAVFAEGIEKTLALLAT